MDVDRVIAELRRELEFLDQVIVSLERQGPDSPPPIRKREKHRPRTVPDA
jgi:hypothetical protein